MEHGTKWQNICPHCLPKLSEHLRLAARTCQRVAAAVLPVVQFLPPLPTLLSVGHLRADLVLVLKILCAVEGTSCICTLRQGLLTVMGLLHP